MIRLTLLGHFSRYFRPMIFNEHYFYSKYPKTFVIDFSRLNQASFPNNLSSKRNFSHDIHDYYNTNCYKCNESIKMSVFKCPHCGQFQNPDEVHRSYFQIFDEQQMYKLDEEKLKQKFRLLQSEYHPDKCANQGDNERNISEQVSSFINKAYSTLTNPYERGVYLLKLCGIEMSESDTESIDKQFLMEIMELNEEVEQINDAKKLLKLEENNDEIIKLIANNVAIAFKSKNYPQAKRELQKMKYFISLRNRIREKKLKF